MNLRFEDWLIVLVVLVAIFMLLTSDNNGTKCQNYQLIETLDPPTATTPSDEAWRNIASVYNGGNLTATLIKASDTLTANNLKATKGTVEDLTAPKLSTTDLTATGLVGANIKLSKGWTGYPDDTTDPVTKAITKVTDRAEISNDNDKYKTLMIVGNKSGGGARRVGLWDDVTVNGAMNVTGLANVGGALNVNGKTALKGGLRIGPYDKQMCDGVNLRGPVTANSIEECADGCANLGVPCAQYYKSGNTTHCYCKNTFMLDQRSVDKSGYTTMFALK